MNEYWTEQFAKWRAEALAEGFKPFSDEDLASLARGLQDSSEGRVKYLGSFADDVEDEDDSE